MKQLYTLLLASVMCLTTGCGQTDVNAVATPDENIIPANENTAASVKTLPPQVSLTMTVQEYPKVGGSNSMLPFSQALFKTITSSEASSYITYTYEDNLLMTNRGFSLIKSDLDLLLMYNPPERLIQEAESAGVPLEMQEIARDALAFSVSRDNPVTNLTTAQIADIYARRVTDWSVFGGFNKKIAIFHQTEDSAAYETIQKLAPAQSIGQSEYIQDFSEIIGYAAFYYTRNMLRDPDMKTLSINGVTCGGATIRNSEYPLIMRIYAAIRSQEPEDSPARQLYNFITSQEGAELLEMNGYVSTLGAAGNQAEDYTPPAVSELVPAASASAPIFPIAVKGKHGFIDINGQQVIAPQYDEVRSIPFYNSRVSRTYGDATPDFRTYHIPPFYMGYKYEENRSDVLNPSGSVIFTINSNAYASFTEDGFIRLSYFLDGGGTIFTLLDQNGNRLIPENQVKEYGDAFEYYMLEDRLYGGKWRVALPEGFDGGFIVLDADGTELAKYKGKFAGFFQDAFYAYYQDPIGFAEDFFTKPAQTGVAAKISPDGTLLDYRDGFTHFEPIQNGVFGFAVDRVYTIHEYINMMDAPDYVQPDPPLGGIQKIYDWRYSPHVFGPIGIMDANWRIIKEPAPGVWYNVNLEAVNIIAGYGDERYLLNNNGSRITQEPYTDIWPIEKYKPDGLINLYFAELPDSSADILDQNGKKLMQIPAGYEISMGMQIYENGLVIPNHNGAVYLDAFTDGKADSDEWVIPQMENVSIYKADENYLISNSVNNYLYDLRNRRFLIKDRNISMELVYDTGSGAVFRAFTDLFDGYIDETGNWIFRQSRFDSLRSTD